MTTSQHNANDRRRHINDYIKANNVQLPDLGSKLTNNSDLSSTQRKNLHRRLKDAVVRKIEGKMVDPTSDEEMAKKRGCATAPDLGRKTHGVSFAQFQPTQLFPDDQGTTAVQPVGEMTAALTVGSPSATPSGSPPALGLDGEDDIANSPRPFAAPLGYSPALGSDGEDAIIDSADSEGTTATSETMSRSKRPPSASDDQPEEPARKKSRFAPLNTSPTILTESEAGTSSTTSTTSSNESFFSSHEGNNNVSLGLGLTFELQHRTLTFKQQQLLQRRSEFILQLMKLMDRDQAAALGLKDEEHKAALTGKDGDHAAALTRKDEEHKAALTRKDGDHAVALTHKDDEHKAALTHKEGDHAAALTCKDDEHKVAVKKLENGLIEQHKLTCEAMTQSYKTLRDLSIQYMATVDRRAQQG